MKFKYVGENDCFCLELTVYGIMKKGEYLKKGMVVDVPNDNTVVINAIKQLGTFIEVKNNIKKNKKENKRRISGK